MLVVHVLQNINGSEHCSGTHLLDDQDIDLALKVGGGRGGKLGRLQGVGPTYLPGDVGVLVCS